MRAVLHSVVLLLAVGFTSCQSTPERPRSTLPIPASIASPPSTLAIPAPPVSSTPPVIPSFDAVMEKFVERHRIPGLSIALARNGRLVHAKGYGFADLESRTPVTTDHVFRVASVSKPITAVAIMKLVQEGKLSLDATVFGAGGILASRFKVPAKKARLAHITVRHLLTHTAGWSTENGDPMFEQLSLDKQALIQYALDTKPVPHEPGTHYNYSNFGYCVLGRVIEAVSGMDYEAYVRAQVLGPAGATGMKIGRQSRADRWPSEVAYYPGRGGSDPYENLPARMDSHGGWVASAIDLVRFVLRVDGFPDPPDLLDSATLQTMTTPGTVNSGVALGWQVNKLNNWWHMGAMSGTSSMIARTSGGYCWAIVANAWNKADSKYMASVDSLMWDGIASVAAWPPGVSF